MDIQALLCSLDAGGIPWSRRDSGLVDVFEPTYIQEALELPGNLSHLIFGEDHTPADLLDRCTPYDDPISRLFEARGISPMAMG